MSNDESDTDPVDSLRFWELVESIQNPVKSLPRTGIYRSFEDLPIELMLIIFEDFSARELVVLSRLSRRTRNVILSHTELQHRIRSDISRVDDGDEDLYTMSERLSKIRAWDEAWKQSKWSVTETLQLTESQNPLPELDGLDSVLAVVDKSDGSIVLHRLPSRCRGTVEVRTWKIKTLAFVPFDVHVDYDQGLLIAVEVIRQPGNGNADTRLHLLSLETGEKHPEATQPFIEVKGRLRLNRPDTVDMEVFAYSFGFLVKKDSPRRFANKLRVWNWKTGELMQTFRGQYLEDVAFLDEDHIILPFKMSRRPYSYLAIVDCYREIDYLEDEIDEQIQQDAALILQLLPLANWSYWDPVRIRRSIHGCHSVPKEGSMAFYPRCDSAVFVFELTYMEEDPEDSCHSIVVPASTIISLLKTSIADIEDWEEPDFPRATHVTLLPWSFWGHNTRYMGLGPRNKFSSICDSRCVRKERVDGVQVAVLYDFASAPALLEDVRNLSPLPKPLGMWPPPKASEASWDTEVLPVAPCRRVVTNILVEDADRVGLYRDGMWVQRAAEAIAGSQVQIYAI